MKSTHGVPLSEIYLAALGMQLRAQAAAARLDIDHLPPQRRSGFRSLLHIEAKKHTESLAVYCLAFPQKAAATIHEAAAMAVADTIKTFLTATTAQ